MLQLNSRIPSEIDIMAQLESLIKKTSFTSFVRKFLSPTVQSTDTLFASGSCTPTKVHFPYTDQMTFAPIPPPPPRHTQEKKKKEKRKEERVLVGALNFRTLCTSMMSKLTPCVLIITLVKMTNNYQRLYTKMNFRLSSYIFLGRQLQRYWILSRPL